MYCLRALVKKYAGGRKKINLKKLGLVQKYFQELQTLESVLYNLLFHTLTHTDMDTTRFVILIIVYCASQEELRVTDHPALKCIIKVTEVTLWADELITSGFHDSFSSLS